MSQAPVPPQSQAEEPLHRHTESTSVEYHRNKERSDDFFTTTLNVV